MWFFSQASNVRYVGTGIQPQPHLAHSPAGTSHALRCAVLPSYAILWVWLVTHTRSQARCLHLYSQLLQRLRRKDYCVPEFKTNLGNIARPQLKKRKNAFG